DDSLLQWGMPMGPLRLIDEICVDITVDIANTLEKAYGKRDRASKILREMQSAKLLGRKSGAGFYKYEGKAQTANDEIEKWRHISAQICDRASKILREMQSAKLLGRKSGAGFYKYEGKAQTANDEIEKWRHISAVIPNKVEGSLGEASKVTQRDPSTPLRSAQDNGGEK